MAPLTPTGVPAELVCGDTLKFYVPSYSAYPISEGWTPSYSFVGAGVLQTTAGELTNDGSVWTCLVPATRTITLDSKEGAYEWYLFFTGAGANAGMRYRADEGRITVKADPTSAQDGDYQAQCEKDLAVLQAAYSGQLTEPMKAYTIRGRQVVFWERSELATEIARLKREVWKLRNPGRAMPMIQFVYHGPV